MFDKYFTLQDAEELLPIVERHMEAIRASKKTLDACDAEFSSLVQRIGLHGGVLVNLEEWSPKRVLREAVVEKIAEEVEALENLGVLVKDFNLGLVDFPSHVGEDEVLLCWKCGESHIHHWHRTTEGYLNRKPLSVDPPPPSSKEKKSIQ